MQTRRSQLLKKELANQQSLLQCAAEFNLVGDPTRLKICYLLCRHQELSVGEIAKIVGVSVSAVSHTLQKLSAANLVKHRRNFRHVYYKLNKTPLTTMLRKRLSQI